MAIVGGRELLLFIQIDNTDFTFQGLVYAGNDTLFESTGLNGRVSLFSHFAVYFLVLIIFVY